MNNTQFDWTELNFKTISTLTRHEDSIPANSTLFEISVLDTNNSYISKSVTFLKISEQLINDVVEYFNNEYGLTSHINLEDMYDDIKAYWDGTTTTSKKTAVGHHYFMEAPFIINSITGEWTNSSNINRVVNIKSLIEFTKNENSIYLNSKCTFTTNYYSIELQKDEQRIGIEHAPSTEVEKHNAFIFRLVGTESEVWTCPASGWFTCYGWVDENSPDNNQPSSRWIVIEGKTENEGWKILQLTPFISSAICSYVSFSFPVKEGLQLRLRSGFKVGTNSGKYWSQRNSLTNHVANSFVGGVYNGYQS